MTRIIRIIAIGAALLLLSNKILAADVQINAVSGSPASVGTPLILDISVSGLGNLTSPSLGAYDLTLQFDSSYFSHSTTSVQNALGDPLVPEVINTITPSASNVNVISVSLLPAATLNTTQADSLYVFRTELNVTSSSFTNSTISISGLLSDENGSPLPLVTSPISIAAASTTPTQIPVFSLPLIALLGCILVFVVFMTRKGETA